MHNLAFLDNGEPFLRVARVQATSPGKEPGSPDVCIVAGPMGMVRARRADGCLLKPETGDLVLVFFSAEESYILSVLEKTGQEGELVLPEETRVETRSMRLKASETLGFEAGTITGKSRSFLVDALLVKWSGKVLESVFSSIQTRAGRIMENCTRKLAFLGRSFEKVKDVKETSAGRVRLTAEETLRVRSRNADMRAEDNVVLDGRNIKIG